MTELATKQMTNVLMVELINGQGQPETKKFRCTMEEGSQVKAAVLKQRFLNLFNETSPILEPEAVTDENHSYHLLSLDEKGKRTTFSDDDTIDLSRYSHFELSPRTTGGARRWNL